MLKIVRVTWPGPRTLSGKLFVRLLDIPNTKPPTKFEVSILSSSSSFGDMFDRMPKIVGVTWPRPRPLPRKIILFVRLCGIPDTQLNTKYEKIVQVVFEIPVLHSKRNGVTSLTFQGHVTSSVTWSFDSACNFLLVVLWNQASISIGFRDIFNVECNATVYVTLIRPLDKGQGHSFWYQSISHIRLPRLSIVILL